MTDRYLTVREAAAYVRVSYRTMQRYLADSRVAYVKPAGRVLVSERSLTEFVQLMNRA